MNKTLKIMKEPAQGKEHVIVMHLNGSLDANGEETLLAIAREVYEEGARFLLLDLAEVDILTSAGMRAMHKVYKMFTPVEERFKVGHVKLCRAPQQMYQSLGVTGFLQTIPSYDSIQEALDEFQ
jgi:anti-anti-sigma factor